MRIVFDAKKGFWKVALDGKIHSLRSNDFLILSSLFERPDRKFHNLSEITSTSKLGANFFKKGIKNLEGTPLINAKKNQYRVSKIGEVVVQRIRNNNIETVNDSFELKKLLGFQAG